MTQANPEETLTVRLARLAGEVRFDALPPPVREVVSRLFRDGWAALLAGVGHPTVALLVEHARELGCAPVSPVFGTDLRTSPQEAAFLLGTAVHVLDFEPMFDPPTHAVSPVLGALAALMPLAGAGRAAAEGRTDGERLLSAFAAGVQLQADLRTAALKADADAGASARFFPFQRLGFHPPGTVGVMGAALASALWLGLDEVRTARALGIAASRACGVAANIGTMTKATHCGNAARAGVESALLARRGFTATLDALGAPGGWAAIFGGGEHFDLGLPERGMRALSCFTEPGFAFKRWPAHTAMQIAIAAALPLHRAGRVPGWVRIEAPALRYCDRPSPRDSDDARFSFQLNVVQSLLDGAVGPESFHEERIGRPEVQALLRRTTLAWDPAIPAEFPRMEVRVLLDDGRSGRADRWPGHWRSPASEEQLLAKFLGCASDRYRAEDARALAELLGTLARLPTLDPILERLTAAGSGPGRPLAG